ncbi:uncharacterized protein LOC112348348 [Selaginella moellendorffii]|uniref:uncharacterized protein LOC112348348 n=1 Tax=Selaginella moellendorffii TaxID=88036 RepID=UPI000D1CA032|nr:uncharacterized protein LOC112348348 [Selaginella moellendorffii]|eukprot:XP_024536484.1 uncharacterized protein LOC112348348 [Selaginella moellendorffii]
MDPESQDSVPCIEEIGISRERRERGVEVRDALRDGERDREALLRYVQSKSLFAFHSDACDERERQMKHKILSETDLLLSKARSLRALASPRRRSFSRSCRPDGKRGGRGGESSRRKKKREREKRRQTGGRGKEKKKWKERRESKQPDGGGVGWGSANADK